MLFRGLTPIAFAVLASAATTVVLPTSSFTSYTTFQQYWNYLYPWGSDHNGSARMIGNSTEHTYISVANNVLTLTAKPAPAGQPPSTSNPHPAIHYFSGTVHAKQQVVVDGTSITGYDVQGEFIASTAKGTWPAFWLTAVNGWPPEADIGEWKGTQQNWFNTFNTSSAVASKIVTWPNDGQFHALKAELRPISGNTKDLSIKYYLDGVLQATHTAANFRGAAMWLILDLQMEGSSGSPGPAAGATFQTRNVQLTKYTP
ncbi:hypothetical protein EXIGLDRAFT_806821 [Exidia glandulosa HHB12029]|uniref:GH16 domain-containing protein n=1 Tax=Exidia glandulosa HHB12029 TaxID=1314781 RepID=A0A165DDX9_EXIGL|nr:hypothetical protein EXIGLDRAFT_806821 [Exidia glandulosa HHB12029]